MAKSENRADKEPDWLDPANERKTPYTDAEIELFVEDFIRGLDDSEWEKIKAEYGEENATERLRTAMRSMDANDLANMTPIGSKN
jgi:hypothetical protein